MRGTSSVFRVGLPMMVALAAGVFVLSKFQTKKYEHRDALKRTKKDYGATTDLSEEYEKLNSTLDISQWTSTRVPRPPGEDEDF
mmetsp:Transcript_12130/g.34195  ORF Transcript_12130/g.34195 Transcript_12130/m.34195 type:complete len:84 (+) Transcript_12130:214-465(+)